jgi:hypothetical protein
VINITMTKTNEQKQTTLISSKLGPRPEENNKPAHVANKAQELQYQRMKLGSFNDFDGEFVGQSLRMHEGLWTAFVFGRWQYCDLIELRDMPSGYVNADTLYILTKKEKLSDLLLMITRWSADEVSCYTEDKECRLGGGFEKDDVLVRVWGD